MTANIDDWIGKTEVIETEISAETANLMQATLNREAALQNGDELPPAWHWLYFHRPVPAAKLGVEGHAALGQFMPPISFGGELPPRRMWAGGHLRFERPIYIGEWAEKRSTIRSITPKTGRSGRLVFVIVEHEVLIGGERCLLEEQTIVYREPLNQTETNSGSDAGKRQTRPSEPAPEGAFRAEYRPDPIMLFRYSALTFNGHRIHYDVDFCREHEGYPNLVVHGPLTATLLLDLFYHQFPNKRMTTFSYRGRHPLFLPHPFHVHGSANSSNKGEAWATDHEGYIAMSAEITY